MPALEGKGSDGADEAVTPPRDETAEVEVTDTPADEASPGEAGGDAPADAEDTAEDGTPADGAADTEGADADAADADAVEGETASDEPAGDETDSDETDAEAAAADDADDAATPQESQAPRPPGAVPRGDFTPHGITTKSRAPGRPATAAAAAKRRKILALAAVGVVLVATAGTIVWVTRPAPSVSASGAFGKAPKISIPKDAKNGSKVETKELIEGEGPQIAKDNLVIAGLIGYGWDGKKSRELFSSYKQNQPMTWLSGQLSDAPALDKALTGRKARSRVLVSIPNKAAGKQLAEGLQLGKTESIVFVADLLGTYPKSAGPQGQEKKLDDPKLPKVTAGKPGEAPKVTMPKTKPPSTLQANTLVEGTGPVVKKGQTLVANYQGQLWRTGKVFDSSWKAKAAQQPGQPPQPAQPATFPIGIGKVVPGWDKSLVGLKAGSRVLLVVPPKDGYPQGQPSAGIKKDDTLVFVVDVLGSV